MTAVIHSSMQSCIRIKADESSLEWCAYHSDGH